MNSNQAWVIMSQFERCKDSLKGIMYLTKSAQPVLRAATNRVSTEYDAEEIEYQWKYMQMYMATMADILEALCGGHLE